jgi:CBS domain-containing protein
MTPSTALTLGGTPRLDRVSDWMKAPVTTVLGEASLVECARLFHRAGIRHLAVTDVAGSLLGMVDDGEVFAEGGFTGRPPVWVSFALGSTRTAADLMLPAEIQTTPDESLHSVLGRWIHSGQDAALVSDGGCVVGILTEHDVLHMARTFLDPDHRHGVGGPVVTVAPWENILRAWEVMGQAGIRHLVIARDNKPLGVVSVRDIVASRAAGLRTIEQIANPSVVTALEGIPLVEAADRMAEWHIGSLPLIGDHGQLVGILTRRDVLHAIHAALVPSRARAPREETSRI